MAYSTPELLQVGAARNLVLAQFSDEPTCEFDNGKHPLQSQETELW